MHSNISALSNIFVGTLGRSVRKMVFVCKALAVLHGKRTLRPSVPTN